MSCGGGDAADGHSMDGRSAPAETAALEVLGASSEAAFGRASSMTVGKVKIPFTLYKTYGTEL